MALNRRNPWRSREKGVLHVRKSVPQLGLKHGRNLWGIWVNRRVTNLFERSVSLCLRKGFSSFA